jgi:hypothetical protein
MAARGVLEIGEIPIFVDDEWNLSIVNGTTMVIHGANNYRTWPHLGRHYLFHSVVFRLKEL